MAEFTIAICDDLEAEQISLARMVQAYARKKGLPITLIHPDKATISKEKPER